MLKFNRKNIALFVCSFAMLTGIVMSLAVAGDEYTEVNLADVIKNPGAYKYVGIEFTCIFKQMDIVDVPFYTPFSKEDYVSFSVWNAGANLWIKDEYANNFPFLFVRKDSAFLSTIIQAKKYTHMEICGVVRNSFNNVPWIEVISVKKSGKRRFNDDSLRHMILGYDYKAGKKYDLALGEFGQAINEKLPDYALGTIYTELALLSLELELYEDAIDYCEKAAEFGGDESQLAIISQAAAARMNAAEEEPTEEPPAGETPVEEQTPAPPVEGQSSIDEIQDYVDRIKELQGASDQKTIDIMMLEATCKKLALEKADLESRLGSLTDDNVQFQADIEEHKRAFEEHLNAFKKYILQTQAQIEKLISENRELSDALALKNTAPVVPAPVTPAVEQPPAVTDIPKEPVPPSNQQEAPEPPKHEPQPEHANVPALPVEPEKKHSDFIAEEWQEFDADKK